MLAKRPSLIDLQPSQYDPSSTDIHYPMIDLVFILTAYNQSKPFSKLI